VPGARRNPSENILVFTIAIRVFTMPILAFTFRRSGCSRCSDPRVHDGPKSAESSLAAVFAVRRGRMIVVARLGSGRDPRHSRSAGQAHARFVRSETARRSLHVSRAQSRWRATTSVPAMNSEPDERLNPSRETRLGHDSSGSVAASRRDLAPQGYPAVPLRRSTWSCRPARERARLDDPPRH
jgi:hypothetical protein